VKILLPSLDEKSAQAFVSLIDYGRSLIQKTATQARTMIRYQEMLPIIDTFKIDASNKVIDSSSMPLLPIVPLEDEELFNICMKQLVTWWCELHVFWNEHRG